MSKSNAYSLLRLAHYGADWERLPLLNPRTVRVRATDLDAPGGAAASATLADPRAMVISEQARAGDPEALRELGRDAFFRYPAQLVGYVARALRSHEDAARYGLWVDEREGVGGIVRVELADGSSSFAFTCATCHVGEGSRDASARGLVVGAGNARLDLGRLMLDAYPEASQRLAAWGPGRADVSTSLGDTPVRIPDLRPVRGLTHLQHDATIEQRGLVSLALRIETLLITGHGEAVRPPREIALALATYVSSLADTLPRARTPIGVPSEGPAIFEARCARCHGGPFFTGAPVALEAVGTDPTAGRSSERGTGMYRVPSLRGLDARGPLLHDGSLPNLDALFDPERTSPSYRGGLLGAGAVFGHAFGLDLDPRSRAALLAYVRAL